MDPSRHLPLMFAVLDGEATPEEVREVEQLIADDAGARAEYEAQRRFFAQLKRASQLDPPSGLADAAANRFQTSRPQAKEKPMSRKISKRALWIGTAVAAAAVVIAAFVFNFPPRGENVSGTVAPAQRYRAEQIKAEDVKLGDQAVAQLMQTEAFERFVRDSKMRALAQDPAFQALARNPEALVTLARNADAVIATATSANATKAEATRAEATRAEATRAEAMRILALMPEAQEVLARYPEAFGLLARDPGFAALAMNPAFANALAANAAAVNASSVNAVEK